MEEQNAVYIPKLMLLIAHIAQNSLQRIHRLCRHVQVTPFRICIRLNVKSSLSKGCFLRHSNRLADMFASVLFMTFKPLTPHSYNCNSISDNCVNK